MPPREIAGVRVTPFEPSVIQRVAAGLRYMVTGKGNDFFGPAQPIAPAAQDEAAGRAFDYPAGYNIQYRPRSEEALGFADLRALAENYSLLRLAIETRKDQMEKLEWRIQARDPTRRAPGRIKSIDPRADALETFLRQPDGEHSFRRWVRLLMEDLLVIDAPTVYVRRTRGGAPFALEVIDGATIKRVLSPDGRTPPAPEPAYQQIIKGLPAVDYTRDELYYRPRNPRPHKVYGYSPVEQIVMIVNIALRRQLFQLAYYTEGDIPDMLVGTPTTWTPKQVADFQAYWDALMYGDPASRRRVKFVPSDLKPLPTRTESLFDEFEEWLARVVCYAYSLPVLPFVKMQNRATAETAQQVALEEGLAPLMAWLKDLIDELIAGPLGAPDYEFSYSDVVKVDPFEQAQIDQIYVQTGVDTPDEVRAARGKEPLPKTEPATQALTVTTGYGATPQIAESGEPQEVTAKLTTDNGAFRLAGVGAGGRSLRGRREGFRYRA